MSRSSRQRTTPLSARAVRRFRLEQLGVVGERRRHASCSAAVRASVFVQAQVYPHALFGVSRRVAGSPTLAQLSSECVQRRGPVQRSWAVRHTMHLIHRDDVGLAGAALLGATRWFAEETHSGYERVLNQVEATVTAHDGELGVTEIQRAVAEHVGQASARAHVLPYQGALHHAIARGAVIRCGKRGRNNLFTHTQRWLGQPVAPVARDDALRALTVRYFAAFGPATTACAKKWLGVRCTQTELHAFAVDAVDAGELRRFTFDGTDVFVDAKDAARLLELCDAPPAEGSGPLVLLPAFDAVTVGYATKKQWFHNESDIANVWKQGAIVEPVVLFDDCIIGAWRWRVSASNVHVRLHLFGSAPSRQIVEEKLATEVERLRAFFELPVTTEFVQKL